MNWNTTIRELADRGELHRESLTMAALSKDTIYMPSEVAAVKLATPRQVGGTQYSVSNS